MLINSSLQPFKASKLFHSPKSSILKPIYMTTAENDDVSTPQKLTKFTNSRKLKADLKQKMILSNKENSNTEVSNAKSEEIKAPSSKIEALKTIALGALSAISFSISASGFAFATMIGIPPLLLIAQSALAVKFTELIKNVLTKAKTDSKKQEADEKLNTETKEPEGKFPAIINMPKKSSETLVKQGADLFDGAVSIAAKTLHSATETIGFILCLISLVSLVPSVFIGFSSYLAAILGAFAIKSGDLDKIIDIKIENEAEPVSEKLVGESTLFTKDLG